MTRPAREATRKDRVRAENAGAEIRVGVSTCLLGEEVRYDGGHKRDAFLNDTLAPFVRFVPVCPEVDLGLGIPREPIRLEQRKGRVRLVAPKSGTDVTNAMQRYSTGKVRELTKLGLCGYILKKGSPSCGMERVRVYGDGAVARRSGRGAFAAVLMERLPDLPVEEEGRLRDPRLRENFLVRVFAYRRLQTLFTGRWTAGDLVRFHTAEKLLLLSHDPASYRRLGRIVATLRGRSRREIVSEYSRTFTQATRRMATVRKHVNVLQHVQGHFKKRATNADRRELEAVIEDYKRALVPLVVPITLVGYFVRRYEVEYLHGQTYLEPHPKELMLRNHV